MSAFLARAASAVLAANVLAGIGGCAMDLRLPPEIPPVTPVPESLGASAKIGYGLFKSNGKKVRLVSVAVDGAEQLPQVYVDPGSHTVLVRLEWSNHWIDETELVVGAEAGHRYAIVSFELAPGQAEAKAEVTLLDARPKPTYGQIAAGGAAAGALQGALPMIILTAPVWWPIYEIAQKHPPPPPKGRPFDNCCFVWIQEVDSGAIVAGSRPRAAGR